MTFIEQYVHMRFRMWSRNGVFIIYEAFPEEGLDVSKKLRQFNNQAEAEEWMEHHKNAYIKWLQTFMVSTATSPASPPPSPLTTTSSLQKAKKRLSESSAAASKQSVQKSQPMQSTASETSQASSESSLRVIRIPADEVKAGDEIKAADEWYTVTAVVMLDNLVQIQRKEAEDSLIYNPDQVATVKRKT